MSNWLPPESKFAEPTILAVMLATMTYTKPLWFTFVWWCIDIAPPHFCGSSHFSLTMADPVEITIVWLGQTLEVYVFFGGMSLNVFLCLVKINMVDGRKSAPLRMPEMFFLNQYQDLFGHRK